MLIFVADGRWITDDYYEEKVLPTLAEKGAKPGDLVGELPDPSGAAASSSNLATLASTQANAGADKSGPSLGMYRAGGPTTIFGGSGMGPYSDGPLNAVRKSYLNREGLNEENWMLVAAQRAIEMDDEWKRLRRENLKVLGGIFGDEVGKSVEKSDEDVMNVDVEAYGQDSAAGGSAGQPKKKRKAASYDTGPLPLGTYEPQTGGVLCKFFACSTHVYALIQTLYQTEETPSPPTPFGNLSQIPRKRNTSSAARRLAMAHGVWPGSTHSWSSLRDPLTSHGRIRDGETGHGRDEFSRVLCVDMTGSEDAVGITCDDSTIGNVCNTKLDFWWFFKLQLNRVMARVPFLALPPARVGLSVFARALL